MNNAEMSDSHKQMIAAESQAEKRTRKKQPISDKLVTDGSEVTSAKVKVSVSEAPSLDNAQTEQGNDVSRDCSSPSAIDYSVKRLSGRFVPFQKEQVNDESNGLNVVVPSLDKTSSERLANCNAGSQAGDKVAGRSLAHQYRPIKPNTQKNGGGRSSQGTTEPRVKRKYKRKEQTLLATPKVHKRRRSRVDNQQPSPYYNPFSQANDILRGLYTGSALPVLQAQQDVLQGNRMFSMASPTPPRIQSVFSSTALPEDTPKESQGGEPLASAATDSPVWTTQPQTVMELAGAGKLKLNAGGIRLMPFLTQNSGAHHASLFQCGESDQINGSTSFQLLPVGPFQLINYQPNPQQLRLGSVNNNSQVGLQINQQAGGTLRNVIPMQMSRLTVIPSDLDTSRQHVTVEAQQTQLNADTTGFMEGPPGSPAFIIQDVVRRIHLNSNADTSQLSIKSSHVNEEHREAAGITDSQCKENEHSQSSVVLVDRSDPSVRSCKRASVESRRSSHASCIVKTMAFKGDDFITHVVDGHIIKESLLPYKNVMGDDCTRPNQLDSSNLHSDLSNFDSCNTLDGTNSSPTTHLNLLACSTNDEGKSSRTENDNNSVMRKIEDTRRKSTRHAKPVLGISASKQALVCHKGNKRSRKSIAEMPDENVSFGACGENSRGEARKQLNRSPARNDEPNSRLACNDPAQWTVDDVCRFVADVLDGSRELADTFRAQEIDGTALLLVKEEFLMQYMNMKLGPALKLCSRISDLRVTAGKQQPRPNAATLEGTERGRTQ